MKDIILDCDPGVDDALALIIGLQSPEITIRGITTVRGNLPVEMTTENVCRLLDYFDKNIPVAKGSNTPLEGSPIKPASNIHGEDGLGDGSVLPTSSPRSVREDAVVFLLEKVHDGASTLVATGPLTNVALAFKESPETMHDLEQLVIMGGAFFTQGNVSPLAEFNFYADPYAADYVLRQSVPTVILPLNITRQVLLSDNILHKLSNNKITRLIHDITQQYMETHLELFGTKTCPLHDPLTFLYLLSPDAFALDPLHVRVETTGCFTRGVCVPERRPWINKTPNCKAVLTGDTNHLLDLFVKLIG